MFYTVLDLAGGVLSVASIQPIGYLMESRRTGLTNYIKNIHLQTRFQCRILFRLYLRCKLQ